MEYRNNYNSYNNTFQEEKKIDLVEVIGKFLKRWYFFAITVPLFVGIAYYQVKSTPYVYEMGAKMIIEAKSSLNRLSNSEFSPGDLLQGDQNLENEIGILGSISLIQTAIEKLDFEISYFETQGLRIVEKYKDPSFPFDVDLDKTHNQLLGSALKITFLSRNRFSVFIDKEKYSVVEGRSQQIISVDAPLEIEDMICETGKPCVHSQFSFVLNTNEKFKYDPEDNPEYYFVYNTPPSYAALYAGKMEIAPISEESTILMLKTEGSVPQKEIDFLDSLCSSYIQYKLNLKNEYANNTIVFIDEQLQGVSQKIEKTRQDVQATQSQAGGIDIQSTASSLREEQRQVRTDLDRAQGSLNYYKGLQRDIEVDPSSVIAPQQVGVQNGSLQNLITNMLTLLQQKTELLTTYTETNPRVQALQSQIESSQRNIKQNIASITRSTENQVNTLRRRLGSINGQLRALPMAQRTILNIEQAGETNEELYGYLAQKKAEAAIALKSNTADARILDNARLLSPTAIAPKKGIIIATALILALVLPAFLIIILDLFNSKLGSVDEVEKKANIPVLASVINAPKKSNIFDPEFLFSPFAESFRYVKANLQHVIDKDPNNNVISVTSTVKGEGKTFISSHLAVIMGLSGKRTIILGADIRRPQLYNRLELANDVGLSNYLSGNAQIEDIIQKTKIQNLYAITSGEFLPYASELLSSERFGILIEALKREFDIVIVDTPPVGLVSDYLLICKHTNINLYVIRQNYSKTAFIDDVNKLKEDNSINNMYFIVNDVKHSSSGKYYGRYGKRYSYTYRPNGSSNGSKAKGFWKKRTTS